MADAIHTARLWLWFQTTRLALVLCPPGATRDAFDKALTDLSNMAAETVVRETLAETKTAFYEAAERFVSGVCPQCAGDGVIEPAHDLIARPPREAAEYEQQRQEIRLTCPMCSGSGRGPRMEGDASG